MTTFSKLVAKSALTLLVAGGALAAGRVATDLSKYRDFQLGSNLEVIAKKVGALPSEAKVIHSRPVLMQELTWRPRPLGPSSRTESVQEVVFSFYGGELFQIAVNYDAYETEGMTPDDFIEAISATYGAAERSVLPASAAQGLYGDKQETIARWQDSQYCFDLIRSSYGPTFKMLGVMKRLATPAQAAIDEAKRLDEQDAPQREAARVAGEKDAEQAKLEKARLQNKPRFRQ